MLALRAKETERQEKSDLIRQTLCAQTEFCTARTIMCYASTAAEVDTMKLIDESLDLGKLVLMPFMSGEEIRLSVLRSLAELSPGAWGVLEPESGLRNIPDRQAVAADVELAVIPGVAFDRRGGRLGRGKGCYDRFLRQLRPGAVLIGLAFESQMTPDVYMEPHDQRVDMIITERQIYYCRPKRA